MPCLQKVEFFPTLWPVRNQEAGLEQHFFSSSTVTVQALWHIICFSPVLYILIFGSDVWAISVPPGNFPAIRAAAACEVWQKYYLVHQNPLPPSQPTPMKRETYMICKSHVKRNYRWKQRALWRMSLSNVMSSIGLMVFLQAVQWRRCVLWEKTSKMERHLRWNHLEWESVRLNQVALPPSWCEIGLYWLVSRTWVMGHSTICLPVGTACLAP